MIATPSALPTFCIVDSAPDAAPGVLGPHPRQDDRRQRRDPEAHPGADQHQARDQHRDRAADADLGDGGEQERMPARRARARRRPAPRRPCRVASAGAPHRGDEVRGREDREHQPGVQRRSAPGPAGGTARARGRTTPGPHQNTSCASSPALNVRSREQAQVEQRRAAAPGEAALVGHERAEDHGRAAPARSTSTPASRAGGRRRAAARSRSARP